MLRDIYLYGELADSFGAHHRLDVRSIKEMLWALDVNYEGKFFSALRKDQSYQVVYGDSLESDPLAEVQLSMLFGPGSFHLAPVIEGSGGGGSGKAIGMAVLGVALIATGVGGAFGAFGIAGAAAPGMAGFALGSATSMFSLTWGTIAMAGGVLALGGVSQLLSPTPDVANYDARDATPKSYMFNGPVNTIEQGSCIPVVFGKHWIGSTVVSAGITTYEGTPDQGDIENPPQIPGIPSSYTGFLLNILTESNPVTVTFPDHITVDPAAGYHDEVSGVTVPITVTSSEATNDWIYIYVNSSVVYAAALNSSSSAVVNVQMFGNTTVKVEYVDGVY